MHWPSPQRADFGSPEIGLPDDKSAKLIQMQNDWLKAGSEGDNATIRGLLAQKWLAMAPSGYIMHYSDFEADHNDSRLPKLIMKDPTVEFYRDDGGAHVAPGDREERRAHVQRDVGLPGQDGEMGDDCDPFVGATRAWSATGWGIERWYPGENAGPSTARLRRSGRDDGI